MRRTCVVALFIVLAVTTVSAQRQSTDSRRPNVVLIITDDVGYGDFGSYGAPDIKTPNVDRLAREGVRFTDFYANGAVCTPTRTALITGRCQQRVGLENALGAHTRGSRARVARHRPFAAAAVEEQWLCHGASSESGISAHEQTFASGEDYLAIAAP